VLLPNGNGKKVRVAVFTDADNVQKALKAGADLAGSDEILDQVENMHEHKYTHTHTQCDLHNYI